MRLLNTSYDVYLIIPINTDELGRRKTKKKQSSYGKREHAVIGKKFGNYTYICNGKKRYI